VIFRVIGVNPLIEAIDGYVHRTWKSMPVDKVVLAGKVVYILRCVNEEDK